MRTIHKLQHNPLPELRGKVLPLAILVAVGGALPGSAVADYASSCAGCHGPLATSTKKGRSASAIQAAITNNIGNMGFLSSLSATQISAIASELAPAATPAPKPTTAPTPKPTTAPTPAPTPKATTAPAPTPQGTAAPAPTPQGTATPAPTPGGTPAPSTAPEPTPGTSPSPSASPAPTSVPGPAKPTSPAAANHVPTIDATPGNSASVAAGSSLDIKVEASDADGDPLTLSAYLDNKKLSGSASDGSASFSVKNGVASFRWTPGKRNLGQHPLLLKVSDGKSTSEQELDITVKRAAWINERPELNAIPSAFLAKPGSELKIPLGASDPDGDRIGFKAGELPEGAKLTESGFDPASKLWKAEIVYTPATTEAGKRFPLQISASDDFNANHKQVSKQTEIVVLDAEGSPADAKIASVAIIKAFARNHDHSTEISGKLSLVDKAGSFSGYTVNLTDAKTEQSLGTASLNSQGEWRVFAPSDTLCAVRAEVGGHVDEKAVRNAPGSCKE